MHFVILSCGLSSSGMSKRSARAFREANGGTIVTIPEG